MKRKSPSLISGNIYVADAMCLPDGEKSWSLRNQRIVRMSQVQRERARGLLTPLVRRQGKRHASSCPRVSLLCGPWPASPRRHFLGSFHERGSKTI